jgi:hypothetical protein
MDAGIWRGLELFGTAEKAPACELSAGKPPFRAYPGYTSACDLVYCTQTSNTDRIHAGSS